MKQCDWLGPSPFGIQTPSRLCRVEPDLSSLVLLKRDRCPEKLGFELAGERKDAVAQDLGIDTLKIPSPIKSVVRIDRTTSRTADRGLAVSGRKKDPTMQVLVDFDDEADREPADREPTEPPAPGGKG